MKIFSICDTKADGFMQPFFCDKEEVAKREFGNLANDETHPIGKHKEDYTLYWIGVWDPENGTIEGVDRKALANGLDYA